MSKLLYCSKRPGWATALTSILAILVLAGSAAAATINVDVAPGGLFFSPSSVTIQAGDTVTWTWKGSGHSVTSGLPGDDTGLFDSGVHNAGFTFSFTFPGAGAFDYHCTPHGACCGMIGKVTVTAPSPSPTPSPTPTATPTPTPRPPSQAQLLNISTRMRVQTGDNVLIGGFIVTGTAPKKVLLRAIGPSLATQGVTDVLDDPELELHASDGSLITSNDDWKSTQQTDIEATGLAPTDDHESAIIATLAPDSYTAIVLGKNDTSGVGLVEGYDLDAAADSQLANISTRGFVEAGSNVMIGGFILGNATGTTNVLIRALGPSLTAVGVQGALADPTLEIHDQDGAVIATDDNWQDSQQDEIEATGLAPGNELESAILTTLPAAATTAIVAGQNGQTGVALVEVYRLP